MWKRTVVVFGFLAHAVLTPMQTLAGAPLEQAVDRLTFAPILEKVMPAVVSVRVKGPSDAGQNPLFSHPVFGRQLREELLGGQPEEFVARGSGTIIDAEKGLIVTNFHVIERAREILVRLTDGREYPARIVGSDPATDVTLMRIDASGLTAAPPGNSLSVRVGDVVIALGNPLGMEATATMGMVSALRRTTVGYRKFEGYIQHDAPVNYGSSGGPLIRLSGEMIGINTAILSPSGGNVGLGFALPAGLARRVIAQLAKYGTVRRGQLGLTVEDVTQEAARKRGREAPQGALIRQVQAGSSAEKAGLRAGDIVVAATLLQPTEIKLPIVHGAHLDTIVAVHEVGQEIIVHVEQDAGVTAHRLAVTDLKPQHELVVVPASIVRLAGVVLRALAYDDPLFGVVKGALVTEVPRGSMADFVGLRAGDIITSVEASEVRQPADVQRLVRNRRQRFELQIVRDGIPTRVQFPL